MECVEATKNLTVTTTDAQRGISPAKGLSPRLSPFDSAPFGFAQGRRDRLAVGFIGEDGENMQWTLASYGDATLKGRRSNTYLRGGARFPKPRFFGPGSFSRPKQSYAAWPLHVQ
jgi:hypothetical protein